MFSHNLTILPFRQKVLPKCVQILSSLLCWIFQLFFRLDFISGRTLSAEYHLVLTSPYLIFRINFYIILLESIYFLSSVFWASYELGHKMHLHYLMYWTHYNIARKLCAWYRKFASFMFDVRSAPHFMSAAQNRLVCPWITFRNFHVFKEAHVKPIESPTRKCQHSFYQKCPKLTTRRKV